VIANLSNSSLEVWCKVNPWRLNAISYNIVEFLGQTYHVKEDHVRANKRFSG